LRSETLTGYKSDYIALIFWAVPLQRPIGIACHHFTTINIHFTTINIHLRTIASGIAAASDVCRRSGNWQYLRSADVALGLLYAPNVPPKGGAGLRSVPTDHKIQEKHMTLQGNFQYAACRTERGEFPQELWGLFRRDRHS
jgi:hypothetical protein